MNPPTLRKFRLFIFICALVHLIAYPQFSHSQPFNVDSLRKKIESASADTNKVWMLARLSTYYNHNKLDSGSYYVREMITLSQKLSYPYGEAWGYNIMATTADRSGDEARAFELALTGLKIAERLSYGRDEMLSRAYTQMGLTQYLTSRFEPGLQYLRAALYFAKQTGRPESSYFQIYAHVGNLYNFQGNGDSARYYVAKAYDLSKKSDNILFLPFVRNIYGETYEKKGKPDTAIANYHEAVYIATKINHLFMLARAYNNLARIYIHEGNEDSCIFYAKQALFLSQKYYFGQPIVETNRLLSEAFDKKGLPDSALKYLKVMTVVKDSVMSQGKQLQFQLLSFAEDQRQDKIAAAQASYRNKARTIVLISILALALLATLLLFLNNRQKQKANAILYHQREELETTLTELKTTQNQLVQSEKMASLGEMIAGIAHEIQNPLNFVNNFAEVNEELLEELNDALAKGDIADAKQLAADLKSNQEKIKDHGKRADGIVKSMLMHSRTSTGQKEPTDVNSLVDEYLRLSYHGMRAKDKAFNATLETDYDPNAGSVPMISQDMGRVILNLLNNAFYAVQEKSAGEGGDNQPTVRVSTRREAKQVLITISDNGPGIPDSILNKIMQPFFTTKPTGKGTGLGLSLSYDIVTKGHGGDLRVQSTPGKGTTFLISLPVPA